MASRLYSFYLKAGEIGGVKARTRLSVLTKITSIQASSIIDSEENVILFEEAMKQIVEEFGQTQHRTSIATTSVTTMNTGDFTYYLRKHLIILSDLMAQRTLFMDDLALASKRIAESVVNAIQVERCGIWLFDKGKEYLTCENLYIRSANIHEEGFKLYAKDFPRYFASICMEKTLAANDANVDPRTSEFSESYLKSFGIASTLDVPIWVDGKMVGVICCEHVGSPRKWTTDEENFVYTISNLMSITIEMHEQQVEIVEITKQERKF